MSEVFFHGAANTAFELFKVPAAAMSVTVSGESAFASEQLIDGHIRPFSFYVPQGLVEAAEGVVQDRAVTPIGTRISVLPHVLYVVGVAALSKGIQIFIDGDGYG